MGIVLCYFPDVYSFYLTLFVVISTGCSVLDKFSRCRRRARRVLIEMLRCGRSRNLLKVWRLREGEWSLLLQRQSTKKIFNAFWLLTEMAQAWFRSSFRLVIRSRVCRACLLTNSELHRTSRVEWIDCQCSAPSHLYSNDLNFTTRVSVVLEIHNILAFNCEKVSMWVLHVAVPPNGLVIYCGTIMTEEGKEKKVNIDFEPFRPINTSLYLCDNKFHTEVMTRT